MPATGRVGAILCAVTCLLMGVSMVVGSFLSFLVLYWGGLFVLPVAALVLGLGMVRGGGLPWWGSAPVLLIPAVGVVTYGFHTLARETWDPPDVVYFTTLGVAWALLGWANRYMSRRVTPA
ncbi:MAG TPA: hypothetical protein VND22_03995 [Actinomycetota bacterium]|nr:hypothetical protein [Actinomycetota bacterium]